MNINKLKKLPKNILAYNIKSSIDPWFISGFSDAESAFVLKLKRNPQCRSGWHINPSFDIGLHIKDLYLLKEIHGYFKGIGNIY